jgi:hypothetical protein
VVSQLKVNEIIKQSGSSISIGEDGDTVSGPFTMVPDVQAYLGSDQSISDKSVLQSNAVQKFSILLQHDMQLITDELSIH